MRVYGAAPDGAYAEWRFDAPSGTTVTAASITRDIGNRDEWTPYGRIDGLDQSGESCMRGMNQSFCRIQGTRTFSGLNARSIAYGVRCVTAPYCAHLWDLRAVWVLVLGATVTLDDRQPPTVSAVEASGVADGRWWNRGGTVVFSAQDNTGIRRRKVVVDGVQRALVEASGAAAGGCGEIGRGVAYTFSRPCAGGRGLNGVSSIGVDPCRWGDGVHSVRGAVTDTGGLEAVSSVALPVRVDCTPPGLTVDVPALEVLEGESVDPVVAVSDPVSGLQTTVVELSVDDGAWESHDAALIAEAGRSYRFRARAIDVAGNSTGWVESGSVLGVAAALPEPEPEPEPERDPEPDPLPEPQPPLTVGTTVGVTAGEVVSVVVAGDPAVPAPAPAAPVEREHDAEPAATPPVLADPHLRITRVLTSRRGIVRIMGSAAAALTTRANVRVRAGARTWARRVAIDGGRWHARHRIRRGARVRAVRVESLPTDGFAAGRATWSRKPLHPLR